MAKFVRIMELMQLKIVFKNMYSNTLRQNIASKTKKALRLKNIYIYIYIYIYLNFCLELYCPIPANFPSFHLA
jgi:hypothetical protein